MNSCFIQTSERYGKNNGGDTISSTAENDNKGVRIIRYPRVKKFRNKTKRLIFLLNLAFIWYALIGTGVYLTSNTNAAFNDVEVINYHLHTQWDVTSDNWDKSSLQFVGTSGFDCNIGFYQELKNNGEQMQGPSTFVIYYKESGSAPNPNDLGKEVFRGEIPALKSGETIKLTYLPTEKPGPGKYKFMALQRPGHPSQDGNADLWGDEIQVDDHKLALAPNINKIQEGDLIEKNKS